MTAKLLEIRDLAPDVRHFVFEVEDADRFAYVPGQFVSFTAEIDGSPITRAYSMASPACGKCFDLCLNRVVEGHFSPYLFDLEPGAKVQMTGPWGTFIFRQPIEDSILVATGTGVVPFRAMLQAQLPHDTHEFTLIHGARYEHGLLYRNEFEELARRYPNFRYLPTISRPGPAWQGRTGHVQPHLLGCLGDRRDVNVFICGLKLMVDDVRSELKALGFDRKRIIYEKYN